MKNNFAYILANFCFFGWRLEVIKKLESSNPRPSYMCILCSIVGNKSIIELVGFLYIYT